MNLYPKAESLPGLISGGRWEHLHLSFSPGTLRRIFFPRGVGVEECRGLLCGARPFCEEQIKLYEFWSSHGGSAVMNPLVSVRMQVHFLALLSGLRIWCCHELWCSWQMQLESGVFVPVA